MDDSTQHKPTGRGSLPPGSSILAVRDNEIDYEAENGDQCTMCFRTLRSGTRITYVDTHDVAA